MDLDAYLKRIAYAGERSPTLATLCELVQRHAASIPFENLSPLIGEPVELDLAALERKLVRGGRGGYCFEQNALLGHALDTLGFRWTGLTARVLWNAPEGTVTPETHMMLRVELDGEDWLADVGFGGTTPTAPLRLVPDIVQSTPHESFRYRATPDAWLQQIQLDGQWRTQYRFDLRERFEADYRMANWYVSTYPSSMFRHTLIAALPGPEGRLSLRNTELSEYTAAGNWQHHLASAEELRETLSGRFGLRLPLGPALDAALERVAAQYSNDLSG